MRVVRRKRKKHMKCEPFPSHFGEDPLPQQLHACGVFQNSTHITNAHTYTHVHAVSPYTCTYAHTHTHTHTQTCCVLMSVAESQQPNPGWEWYQPTTIWDLWKFTHTHIIHTHTHTLIDKCTGTYPSEHINSHIYTHIWSSHTPYIISHTRIYPYIHTNLFVCLSISNMFAWKTGSTDSTLTEVPLWGIANTSTTRTV